MARPNGSNYGIKIKAPKINAIYIGEKASKENKEKLIAFCKERNIKVRV